ncbi:hypothetical protein CBOM_05837 [Ceraceosorus bombacis]|uniref:Uncharacterized protein n=1 Tax=Ceraceosorus bombacis TaxID=401625 RepID=A0A0P1BQI0_9BASI|nr:hypothetical protein CBOM_05837 [Ceraceosorus bombacis]
MCAKSPSWSSKWAATQKAYIERRKSEGHNIPWHLHTLTHRLELLMTHEASVMSSSIA